MKFKYFISYTFQNGEKNGSGCCEIKTDKIIKNNRYIKKLAEQIGEACGFDAVAILNYKLLGRTN